MWEREREVNSVPDCIRLEDLSWARCCFVVRLVASTSDGKLPTLSGTKV